jgi:hypothetical protein
MALKLSNLAEKWSTTFFFLVLLCKIKMSIQFKHEAVS